MASRKILYITNIPAPYRTYRFNLLNKYLNEEGIELNVFYMNTSEPDRFWKFDPEKQDYKFEVFSTRPVNKFMGMYTHFPLRMFSALRQAEYDLVVLGGIASPAHILTALTLRKNALKILSVESNLISEKQKGSFASYMKRTLYRRFDAYQFTGQKAREYCEKYTGALSDEKVVYLPNVIDESLLRNQKENVNINTSVALRKAVEFQDRTGKLNKESTVLIAARLEPFKGLKEFFRCLPECHPMRFIVAGTGSLHDDLSELIRQRGLNVELIGHVTPQEIAALMELVDFFALPSLSDPSPLSPIEATAFGLPLILSCKIGNVSEVLREGENGWSFDPSNCKQIASVIERASKLSEVAYQEMREASWKIFRTRFHSELVLKRYVGQLIKLLN